MPRAWNLLHFAHNKRQIKKGRIEKEEMNEMNTITDVLFGWFKLLKFG